MNLDITPSHSSPAKAGEEWGAHFITVLRPLSARVRKEIEKVFCCLRRYRG